MKLNIQQLASETIELNSTDLSLLEALKVATNKTYEELIRTAITNLCYKQSTFQDLFNIEVTDAT